MRAYDRMLSLAVKLGLAPRLAVTDRKHLKSSTVARGLFSPIGNKRGGNELADRINIVTLIVQEREGCIARNGEPHARVRGMHIVHRLVNSRTMEVQSYAW